MKTVAIIPARYASERLPGTPLALIAGRPMIEHVVRRTQQASRVSDVIVATDDERIASAVRAFGGRAIMTSSGLTSGTDRVAEVARILTDIDIVVNVQGDEPMIAPAMIDRAIEPFQQDTSIVATSAAQARGGLRGSRSMHRAVPCLMTAVLLVAAAVVAATQPRTPQPDRPDQGVGLLGEWLWARAVGYA